jgi:hypothetical protein
VRIVSRDQFSVFSEASTSTYVFKKVGVYKVDDGAEKAVRFVNPSTSPTTKAGWSSGPPLGAQRQQFVVPVKPEQSGLGGGGGGFSHPATAAAVGRWWCEQSSISPASEALAPSEPILAQAGRELGMQAGRVLARGQGQGWRVTEQDKGGVDGLQNDRKDQGGGGL